MDARDAHRLALDLRLRSDDQARTLRSAKENESEGQRKVAAFWQTMNGLIGSADGKKLRVFAQSLTFAALLEEANHSLRELSRRYSLAPAVQGDLEFQIIDHDMADEIRSSSTLSGGESFLVSLALSLGLSALGASKTRVESVFIDEGFGTLDNRSLDVALASLEALQATGRQIGVISHVDRLATKIGARVTVKRTGVQSAVIIG
jgi:exonuclease SbcC